jgi:lipopolysaccharide transport system ATP-binding protein
MNDAREVMLELRNVSLVFESRGFGSARNKKQVLRYVSLDLFRGETLGLIGENGCGKTTILRLMAGIFAPTTGTVTRRSGTSAALLSLGLGFQGYLSGRDNAVLSAMLQGSSHDEARSFLPEIKKFSELGDAFEQPVKTYSSGMRSRLGFTTALVTNVDILFIDEVLSVGDAHFKQKAERAMKSRITGQQTVVFVSHSEGQISSLCDRAIWLNDGIIAAEGATSEVIDGYRGYVRSIEK